MQGSEQGPSLAASMLHTAAQQHQAEGRQHGPRRILVSGEAFGICSVLPGSVAGPTAHQAPLPTQA